MEKNKYKKEEDAKNELKELLELIPIKTENEEFINEVRENIRNREYSIALEKIEKFLDMQENEEEQNNYINENMPPYFDIFF